MGINIDNIFDIMPRSPRLYVPFQYYHIFNRGMNRGTIFRTEADYRRFLERLAESTRINHPGGGFPKTPRVFEKARTEVRALFCSPRLNSVYMQISNPTNKTTTHYRMVLKTSCELLKTSATWESCDRGGWRSKSF